MTKKGLDVNLACGDLENGDLELEISKIAFL